MIIYYLSRHSPKKNINWIKKKKCVFTPVIVEWKMTFKKKLDYKAQIYYRKLGRRYKPFHILLPSIIFLVYFLPCLYVWAF